MKAKEQIMAIRMYDPRDVGMQINNTNTNKMSEKLEVTGTITEILPAEEGMSKAEKPWKKQSFVIDTNADFNPLVCFQVFGEDRIEKVLGGFKKGDVITVGFNVSSREFNGKYYHNLDAWMSRKAGATKQGESVADEKDDSLPF